MKDATPDFLEKRIAYRYGVRYSAQKDSLSKFTHTAVIKLTKLIPILLAGILMQGPEYTPPA